VSANNPAPFSLPIEGKAEVSLKKETVKHIERIETNKFTPCNWTIEHKRKHLFSEQVFAVHVDRQGNIEWEELK
jgi:hypothetical protein